ncbi:DUF6777 domain-containing protein [Streptomyces chartreusis]|uniref:DUF6777 domain-containing protein n=1 Tax=Streptomyces chartreusis TaxID=1969 RepID=UPI002E812CA2|nr:DUF6777 domain-containing protein [Streptomyces chartreusis]WUB15757.1 hypothetical protein OG997_03220 [Streptomyces chartreusis]
MSVEPPSSDRPTGPPSGPLSGPSQPPSGPPSQPPSGGAGTPEPGGPGPRRPWWRSAPRIAALTAVAVAAVVLAVVLSRGDGDGDGDGGTGQGGEVFLQAADKTGPDPFTESTANDSSAPPATPSPPTGSTSSNQLRGVDGGAPGLYGGTRNTSACDVEKQVDHLRSAPDKNRAFASVARVDAADVPAYLRSLTPVQLRLDTRVTNHGYVDGAATSYQAVLQAGTAVLVDDRGEPRVRCACGNPLTQPVPQQGTLERTGDSWPSYRSSDVVVVNPSQTIINVFVIYDAAGDEWVARHRGDDGDKDRKTHRPAKPTPSVSASTPTTPTTPETSTPETATSEPTTSEPPTTEPETPDTSTPPPPPEEDTTTTSQSAPTEAAPPSPEL